MLLVAAEIFFIPGFGIAGVAGAAAILWSLVISFGGIEEAVRSVGISLGLSLVGAYSSGGSASGRGLWGRVVLSTRLR